MKNTNVTIVNGLKAIPHCTSLDLGLASCLACNLKVFVEVGHSRGQMSLLFPYIRHTIEKLTFGMLEDFLWHRVIMWFKTMHHTGLGKASASGTSSPTGPSCQSPRMRPSRSTSHGHRRSPGIAAETTRSQPLGNNLRTTRRPQPWRPGAVMGTPGSARGLEKRTRGNTSAALQADSTGRLGNTEQVPMFVFYAGYGEPALTDSVRCRRVSGGPDS